MDQKQSELPPTYGEAQYGAQYPGQPEYGQPAPPPPAGYGPGYDQKAPPPAGCCAQQYPQPGYVNAGTTNVVMTTNAPIITMAPPDHLVYAILVTIFCCWPIGIFAIIKASSVKDAIARNDMSGALTLSGETRNLCNMALGFGLCINVGWIVFVIIYYTVIVSYTYGPY